MFAGIDVPAFITLLAEAGPIGVGIVALAEKFFPVVPSYVVFVLLGMTAASGQSDLAVTVAATATGSTLGALGWYGLGLALGPRRTEALIERFGRFIFLKPALYQRMAGAYRRNHFWVTVVGQTVPAVRVYLSIPAGVLKLAILNFLGGNADRQHAMERAAPHARICLARAKCGRRLFRSARRHGRGRAGVSWFARLAPGPSFQRPAIAAGLSPERGLISQSRPRHGQEASRGISPMCTSGNDEAGLCFRLRPSSPRPSCRESRRARDGRDAPARPDPPRHPSR